LLVAIERANDRVVLADGDALGTRRIGLRRKHRAAPHRARPRAECPGRLEEYLLRSAAGQHDLELLAEVDVANRIDDEVATGNIQLDGDVGGARDLPENVVAPRQVER
jgi:hypothetical protein